jgi:hypothetical protein
VAGRRPDQEKQQTSQLETGAGRKFAVVIEKAAGNFPAYVPDLPRSIAAASTG